MKTKLLVAAAIVFLAFAGIANVVMADGDSAGLVPVAITYTLSENNGTGAVRAVLVFHGTFDPVTEITMYRTCDYWPNGMGPPSTHPAYVFSNVAICSLAGGPELHESLDVITSDPNKLIWNYQVSNNTVDEGPATRGI